MLEAQQPPPPALDRDAFRLSSPAPPEAAVPVAVAGSAEGDELSWLQYLAEAQQGHAMVDEKAAYAEAVLRFLDSVDGATTRRVVVSGGDQRVAGRI